MLRRADELRAVPRPPVNRRVAAPSSSGSQVWLSLSPSPRLRDDSATSPPYSCDGTQCKGADVQGITPNERFYVVTKNVIDPRVDADLW